ncbi:hypothetical protein [Aurantibacillus circumpalustris]|uniref:hypothetical protein n=1 Tax=Aurantibacillus circumpalustris TaxID=3036359 RepID=UPI00295A6F57|nr:hypothetical protein [Aurantibacillus circumpalustris]
MNIFHNEHLELLKILLKNNVNFLLVGGVAVNFYGYSRPTGDIDIWLEPTNENKLKLIVCLEEIGILANDIKKINDADFSTPMAFHIGNTPPFVIDFLTKIVGVKWLEAWELKTILQLEELNIPFIHINHLKQNKMISGRPKDLNDLSQLLRIEELRKK